MAEKDIPSWPKVTIRLYDGHNAEVKIAGRSHPVSDNDPRQASIQLVSERAAQLGRAVKATAVEPDGSSWPLIIHPDGRVEAAEVEAKKKKEKKSTKPIWPIVVAIGLAVVLIAATVSYLVFLRPDSSTVTQPTASPKPDEQSAPRVVPDQFAGRPAPPGWSTNASWTVDLGPGTAPAVSPDGSEVAIITPDEKIAVFDGSGKMLWQHKVPRGSGTPVYTMIDGKPVVAVVAPDSLYYWAKDGAKVAELALPKSATVRFFGTSPLVVQSNEAGASVISGGELKELPDPRRLATLLLAEGDKALLARYQGPLYWDQPGKERVTVELKPPAAKTGVTTVHHVAAASPGVVLVFWNSKTAEKLIPTVNSSATGAVVATCPTVTASQTSGWQWVPDAARKVSAWGECLINFTTKTTKLSAGFQPQSITGQTIYGKTESALAAGTPGGKFTTLPERTALPWGVVGSRAIVVHDSVLYALDKKK